jgi:hypothetical protein
MKFELVALRVLSFVVLCFSTSQSTQSHFDTEADVYTEDLVITPLPDGKVSAHFRFEMYTKAKYNLRKNCKRCYIWPPSPKVLPRPTSFVLHL